MADAGWQDELDGAVRELAGAEVVAFGGIGIASTLLPVTEAYRAIERTLPDRVDEVRSRLSWLLANGTPAGRVYAAALLGRFDAEAAHAAWSSLVRDPSALTTFTGCVQLRTTLGEYAKRQLVPADRAFPPGPETDHRP